MFDVKSTATIDIYISGLFAIHDSTGTNAANVKLYKTTTQTSFQGNQNNPGYWSVIGESSFNVLNNKDYVGFNDFDPIKLEAGSTQGFYFTSTGTLRAMAGTPPVASDSRLEIKSPGLIFAAPFVPYPNNDSAL